MTYHARTCTAAPRDLSVLCIFAIGVTQLSGSPSIANEAAVGPDDRATIQDMLGTPGRFMEMVRRDYVAVYRPR